MKVLLQLFICLILNSVSAQRIYTNKTFEFSCEIPALWFEGREKGFDKEVELTKRQRTDTLKKEGYFYLINFYDAFTTGQSSDPGNKIQIDIIYKPEKSFQEFKQKATVSAEELKTMFDNVKYIEKPKEITVSGIKGIYFRISYTMIINGKKVELRNQTYLIPYQDYLFHVSMVDAPTEDASEKFEKFVGTLKIGPQ